MDPFDNVAERSPLTEGVVHQKKKLRSWLTERLDMNDCHGCSWIDINQKIFRLSWKHYGRPGFDEDRDATIFRKWAEHTRRYSPGDPPDISTWKTRFRNALHKMPDIEEMTSYHQLDGNDPHRVYRFRTPAELEMIKKSSESTQAIKPPPYPYQPAPYPPDITRNLLNSNEIITANATALEKGSQLSYNYMPNNVGYAYPPFGDNEIDVIEEILRKMDPVYPRSDNNQNCEPLMQPPPMPSNIPSNIPMMASCNNIPPTAIGIKMYFSDKEVECKIVNNPNGLRISHDPPRAVPPDMVQEPDTKNILSNIFGPLEAEQMYYPTSDDYNTQNILKMIQRGVVFDVRQNGDIYATRLSQARVYFSYSATIQPQPLKRSEPTLVYSFENEFVPMLQSYQATGMTSPPSCERYFSLGQTWTENEPLKEMLIHFSITHFLAKKIFKEAKAQRKVEIEVSTANSLDIIHKEFQKMGVGNN